MFEIINNIDKPKRKNFNRPHNNKKVFIETYGCQMNLADSEIVLSVLSKYGYNESTDINESDVILLNTCSVRENAEKKIYNRLNVLKSFKKSNPNLIIGILGCMAERLKKNLIEKQKVVDLIVGPDEYRMIPNLIDNVIETGEKGIAVKLSKVETYDDITPVRKEGVTAFISIMRGCDKFCTFCVVPFTRGRERSRKLISIVNEAVELFDNGIKEITLLGQNVNSYEDEKSDFADLLKAVAEAVPQMRIRYTTSHPYDLSMKLIDTMASYKNICNYIHLPVQSGSEKILKKMNRLYTIKQYKDILYKTREKMPGIGLSTDIIAGFPGETEEDHLMTIELLKEIKYDGAFTFAYSPREHTKAFEMKDSVPDEIKKRRLEEIIATQRFISTELNRNMVGSVKEVLLETVSKKSPDFLMGRTDCNKSVIVPKGNHNIGDTVNVEITKTNSATLFGNIV
jgi:tRNA-2-methylthio-N6-dimethylallyladenosine synthase